MNYLPIKKGDRLRYTGDRHPAPAKPGDLGVVLGWLDHRTVGRYYMVQAPDGFQSLWPWDEVEPEFLN